MKRTFLATAVVSTFLITACGGGKTTEETTKTEEKKAVEVEVCQFSHENPSPEVMWVAYKYTEKTGVKGVFEDVNITGTGSGEDVSSVLSGASISIKTASSNSGDATRDPKIQEAFFGKLESGETISGRITNASGDNASGKIEANITMNGVEKPVSGSYTVDNDKLELKFEINVENWAATDALNALNKVCEDLHKGADGKSILWPDITIFVSTTLNKVCS